MSITNIQTLHDLAETALASYSDLDISRDLKSDLKQKNTGASFTDVQAQSFVDHYTLRSVQANIDWNGFSAAVFQDKVTGEKVIAMRGTEFDRGLGQIGTDLAVADTLGIGASGYANLQGVEMYRYWKKLTTVGGQTVSYSDSDLLTLFAFKLGPVLGVAVLATPVGQIAGLAGFAAFKSELIGDVGVDAGVPGQSVIAPGEKVNVTGHSLGGHLALLFARLFPDRVTEVVTLNAPTFFSHGDVFLNVLGFTNSINSKITRLEADGDGVSKLGNVDPGTAIPIAQENNPGPLAAISSNHSSVNGVDGLALMAVMAKLDTSKASDAAGLSNIIRAGANTAALSYENVLDGLRKQLLGSAFISTPISSSASDPKRTDFYANLQALCDSPTFVALAGKVTLALPDSTLSTKAKTDFAAFLSLNALSPVVISTSDATAIAKLKQANLLVAQQWEADSQLTAAQRAQGQASFSDVYLLDRQAMLQGLVSQNILDKSYDIPLPGKVNANYTYTDFASNQVIKFKGTASNATAQESQQVMFGNDLDNGLVGSDASAAGLGDHLYGGAGNDYIVAKAGDDYLEGNTGDDTLNGGDGQDTLLGGTGDDKLDDGKDSDILNGGNGTDTYTLRASDSGVDTIIDSDGLGSIKVIATDNSETTLGTGTIKKVAGTNNQWESEDKRFTYTTSQQSDGSATLLITGAGVTARVKNFSSGNLGITLPDAIAPETAPASSTAYDLSTKNGWDHWYPSAAPGIAEANYTLLNAVQPAPLGTIFYSATNPTASWAQGLNGNDTIEGGAAPAISQTVIRGNGGMDRMYAGVEQALQVAVEQGETLPGINSSNYLLDGGAGDDLLIGSAGNDVLFGGAGDDTLVGGTGNDLIISDGDVGSIYSSGGADWATGSNDPLTGQTRTLGIVHAGARLYLSPSDSTGQRTATYAQLAYQLDMTYDIDYQALRGLTGQDVRNKGYVYDDMPLDASTPIGSNVVHASGDLTYAGSLIAQESFNTARHTGSDTIYAGAGDDVVNAGGGSDLVLAGSGNDMIFAGGGTNFIDAWKGDEFIRNDSRIFDDTDGTQHGQVILRDGTCNGYHYQLSSWLHPFLLGLSPIRYPKTVKKVSLDVYASCRRMRSSKRTTTTNSITACACNQGFIDRSDSKKRVVRRLQTSSVDISRPIKKYAKGQ